MLRTKRKVIVSLHGIRTRGVWQKDLPPLISEQGWIYYPLDYGWFSFIFFIPGFLRKNKTEWFRKRYNEIRSRYPDVIPSIIAHSFGTWILCKALSKYKNLRFDKIILAGSIVPDDFDWKRIYDRNQVTSVRNDSGKKDIWARFSRFFAWGTGSSGFKGFSQPQPFVVEIVNSEYDHFSAFGYDHYLGEWIPFLSELNPFASGEIPWDSEEPVSPYDAARWSAITYFKQYICGIAGALTRNEMVTDNSGSPVKVKSRIVVLIPKTPGEASQGAAIRYYAERDWQPILFSGSTQRTARLSSEGEVCDIPSTLNSLLCLDHRTNSELIDAVDEFARTLEQWLNDPRSEVKGMVTILRI
jgi:hypothetical protein